MTFTLTKTADVGEAQAEYVRGEGSDVRLENPDEAYRFCTAAPIGEDIKLTVKPLCQIQAGAIRPQSPEGPRLVVSPDRTINSR